MADKNSITPEEKSAARGVHFTSLAMYPLSFLKFLNLPIAALGTAILPLISYFKNRKKSDYVAHQALESFYFHLLLAGIFAVIQFGVLDESNVQKLLSLILYIGVGVFHLGSLIWSSVSTSYGNDFSHILSPFKNYFSNRKEQKTKEQYFDETHSDSMKKMYTGVVENTEKNLVELNTLTKSILNLETKELLTEIQKSLLRLWEDLKKNPDATLQSRHFLNYTLDTTVGILRKYETIQRSNNNEILNDSTEKLNPTLKAIQKAILEHHSKLISNVNMNLDVEIQVIQKTLEMGGI